MNKPSVARSALNLRTESVFFSDMHLAKRVLCTGQLFVAGIAGRCLLWSWFYLLPAAPCIRATFSPVGSVELW